MKKLLRRVFALTLSCIILFECSCLSVFAAEPKLAAFDRTSIPDSNPFTDIDPSAYYYENVVYMYHLNLIKGTSETTFSPNKELSAAECAALAVRIYELYHGITGEYSAMEGDAWYIPYIDKAKQYNFLPDSISDVSATINRKDALYILYRILPVEELTPIRAFYRAPDLFPSDPQYEEIKTLYRSGVVNGTDAYGTLSPDTSLTRGQIAAILGRLIFPELRQTSQFSLEKGLDAFHADTLPSGLPFSDTGTESWYYSYVSTLYNMGLVEGISETQYDPSGTVTLAHAIAIAVRVYEIYHGLTASENASWYQGYLDLASQYKLLHSEWTDHSRTATRAEVAYLVYHALPDALAPINTVTELPDVSDSHPFYHEIMELYRSGILAGSDENGTFNGEQSITRAELAALFARLVSPSQRMSLTLRHELTEVKKVIEDTIAGYNGTWSVYLSVPETKGYVSINNQRMWSASIIKLYVMAAVLDAIEAGTLQDSDLVRNYLYYMITTSNNNAWKQLAAMLGGGSYGVGMQIVTRYCMEQGYPDSGMLYSTGYYNTTSVEDTGLFLERVLAETNVSKEASQYMLKLLKGQQRVSKIPAGVPYNIVTANKTGENGTVQNDSAIIYAPSGTYILVVLTDGGAIMNIRSLSKLIYETLNQ